jgi:hypothetical protein
MKRYNSTSGVTSIRLKHALYIIAIAAICSMIFGSCTPYQSFVTVNPRTDIPEGSKEILIKADLDELLDTLKKEGILFTIFEGGAETEEIMIDEGTRAKFKMYALEEGTKVVPYWGITGAVRQQAAIWAGYNAASMLDDQLVRVVYKKSETRPKKVFDYAANISLRVGRIQYR